MEAIDAFYETVSSKEFKELERLRLKAQQDEFFALYEARSEGQKEEREKWQGVVSEKNMELSRQAALIEELKKQLAEKK